MPRRGYRKGVSDNKIRLGRKLYVRVENDERDIIQQEAAMRGITMSAMVRKIITGKATQSRSQIPHRTGPSQVVLDQLCRMGNNLNQLARHANAGRIPVSKAEIDDVLAELEAAIHRV